MKLSTAKKYRPGDIILSKVDGLIHVVAGFKAGQIEVSFLNDKFIPAAEALKVEGLKTGTVAYFHRRHCYPKLQRAAWESCTDSAKAVGTTLATVKKSKLAIYDIAESNKS
jgi:hypothetical protein